MDRLLDIARRRGAAVLGLGVSGLAAAEYLLSSGVRPLYLLEQRRSEAAEVLVRRGACLVPTLNGHTFGLLIRSPGIPERHEAVRYAREIGATVTGEIGLWFSASRIPSLAVTGSDGKTTTVTLAHAMLSAGGKRALLGGNIGASLLPMLDSPDAELAVLELSSFQLLDAFPLERQGGIPFRGAILNLSENHLDFHGTIDEYFSAKKKILAEDTLPILPLSLAELGRGFSGIAHLFSPFDAKLPYPARLYFPQSGELLCREASGETRRLASLSGFRLQGEHNLKNLLAAVALCDGLVSGEAIERAIMTTEPVDRRMTEIGRCRGAVCIDSSIDSTPSRTATTLRAIRSDSIVLLLGGASKNLSTAPLTEALDARVRAIFTFGREGRRLFDAIEESGFRGELTLCRGFDEAVLSAASVLTERDTLLLSPACTSYDEFQSYTERSRRFRALLRLDPKGSEKI